MPDTTTPVTARKGMILSIYIAEGYRQCGGVITRTCKEVLLVGEGVPEIFDARPDRPAVKLVRRPNLGRDGGDYKHIEPVDAVPAGQTGYMMGGAYVGSSDSRVRDILGDYPLPLHDRSETWEQYARLSN